MQPTFFPDPAAFRKWLQQHSASAPELLVGFYKVGSGRKSITWSESVDQALCFGWIDGVRRGIDTESYSIRFTPRKKGSIWSAVNIAKVAALSEQGLMTPAGLAAFEQRQAHKSAIYSYEKAVVSLDPDYLKRLKANKKAWSFFQSMAPSYQRICTNWVMGAKQEATREKRLGELIADSAAGMKIKSQRY